MPENEVTVYIMIRFYLFIIIINYIFKNRRKCNRRQNSGLQNVNGNILIETFQSPLISSLVKCA